MHSNMTRLLIGSQCHTLRSPLPTTGSKVNLSEDQSCATHSNLHKIISVYVVSLRVCVCVPECGLHGTTPCVSSHGSMENEGRSSWSTCQTDRQVRSSTHSHFTGVSIRQRSSRSAVRGQAATFPRLLPVCACVRSRQLLGSNLITA